jgi:two-component system sensor histidine kinase BaeS
VRGRHGRWREPGHWQGASPPWWPHGEPWPPSGGWEQRRGRFKRRFGCFVLVILLLAAALGTLAVWSVAVAAGVVPAPTEMRLVAVTGVALGLLLVAGAARGFRRLAAPVTALVEAAGRIEEGDYSARVPERGPREVRSLARAFNSMSGRLQQTEERRRSFLADVAHELRTPLTVIQGQAEALIDGLYPADAEHLAPIVDEARQMQSLVEDLRTLSLLEAHALTLDLEPTDAAELASETAAAYAALARANGVDLRVEADGDLGPVPLDASRMRRVLGNLLTNAIRHTPAGGRVTVRVERDDDGGLSVSVADTGTGIPAELLARAFDRFAKGEGSTGSGLGLAIARDLVEAHGGSIVAESPGGHGTTIRIRLPVEGPAS